MGSCYSGDHIAGDYIHTDITACNIEEPQQNYSLRTVLKKITRGLNMNQGPETLKSGCKQSLRIGGIMTLNEPFTHRIPRDDQRD